MSHLRGMNNTFKPNLEGQQSDQNSKPQNSFVNQYSDDLFGDMIPMTWYQMQQKELKLEPKCSYDDFAKGVSPELEVEKQLFFNTVEDLPTYPSRIYANLPPLLRDLTDPITNPNHKDISLLSGLVFCSALFPNVSAEYGGETHYPNLFGMVVAPSSTGKSHIRIGEYLVKEIIKKLQTNYKQQYAAFKNQSEGSNIPEPVQKTFLMSANTSDSALIDSLCKNDGIGIIYTNEMDAQASNEWANLSPIFRQMFDHQLISKDRVNSTVQIESPKCSILYSGTPGQFKSVITDFENGLHQRFMMYHFTSDLVWKSPFNVGFNLQDLGKNVYNNHLSRLLNIYEGKNIKFSLTKDQQVRFDSYFSALLESVKELSDKPIFSLVTRGAKLAHKIAMALTILRNSSPSEIIYCDDNDFEIALDIFDTSVKHSIFLATVKSKEYCPLHLEPVLNLFNDIESPLTRKELDSLAETKNIPVSTLTQHLKQLVQLGFIVKERRGVYKTPLAFSSY